MSKLRTWLTTKRQSYLKGAGLDYKLLRANRSRTIPSWTQFKYINHFLTVAEKRLMVAILGVIAVTLTAWGGVFVARHVVVGPDVGGEYSEALIGQPKYVNPLLSSASDVDSDLTSLIYLGLFRYNKENKLEPMLAESYSVSSDQKTYDITLRQGVLWSDGEPVTVDDVVYTIEAIQNPEIGSPLLPSFQAVSVERVDDHVVRFTLKDPFAPFLDSLTVGIVPEHIWGEFAPGNIRLAKNNLQPIGSGPWRFSKLVKDDLGNVQTYELTRNEKYFFEKPYIKTFVFKFFSDFDQAIEAVHSQSVAALGFAPANQKNRLNNQNLNSITLKLPQYTALFFNQSSDASIKNDDFRKALALAIDKPRIVSEALKGNGEEINQPIPSQILGHNNSITSTPFAIEEANTLLDPTWPRMEPEEYFKMRRDELIEVLSQPIEETTTSTTSTVATTTVAINEEEIADTIRREMDPNQNFYRRTKSNTIVEITITTVDAPEYVATAELVAAMWRQVGVKTNVQVVNYRQILRDVIKDRQFQVLLYGEIAGNDPDLFPFWHSSQIEYPGLNLAAFSDRTADKYLEDARVTSDPAKRAELYQKFSALVVKELPAIFLYSPTHTFIVNKDIRGISGGTIANPSGRYADSTSWYVKTSWHWE